MLKRRRRRGPAFKGLTSLAELIVCIIASRRLCARANAQALYAAYDSSYGAPACLDLGSSCQTDDVMISGVAGFEPNAPNTVDNCTDRSNAVAGQDEYVNRIIVRSKDSGTMRAGNDMEIHVTVDTAVDVSSRSKTDAKEIIHMYYASETFAGSYPIGVNGTHHFGNGHWKWMCTRMADPGGMRFHVFSCDFRIPEGNYDADCGSSCGIQAVRVNYGYGEYAIEPCTDVPLWGEPFSDVDDLVFRLAPPPPSPSAVPSQSPFAPSASPSAAPSAAPSATPSGSPSAAPTPEETVAPTIGDTHEPTVTPTRRSREERGEDDRDGTFFDWFQPSGASGNWNCARLAALLLIVVDVLVVT